MINERLVLSSLVYLLMSVSGHKIQALALTVSRWRLCTQINGCRSRPPTSNRHRYIVLSTMRTRCLPTHGQEWGQESGLNTSSRQRSHSRQRRRRSRQPLCRNESGRNCLSNLMTNMLIGFWPSCNWKARQFIGKSFVFNHDRLSQNYEEKISTDLHVSDTLVRALC